MVMTLEEYQKRKKKRLREAMVNGAIPLEAYAEITGLDLSTIGRATSPNSTITTPNVSEEKDRTWFQKSDGNLVQTIGGSATDLLTQAGSGLLGMGESILDGLMALGPYAQQYQLTGGADGLLPSIHQQKVIDDTRTTAQKSASELIQKELYDEQQMAKSLISDNVKKITGIDNETMSVFGEKSDALAQSAGQLVGQLGANVVLPGAGLVSMGMSSFGSEMENALNNGATYDEALLSGTISAGAEVVTEKLFGYFGAKGMDDFINTTLANKISKTTARTLAKIGVDASGEGAEEVLSGIVSAIGQKLTYMDEKEINELFSKEDALESFIGGAVLGSFGGGANAVKSKVTGKDMVTELTRNEEAVVEAIAKERMKEHEPKLGQAVSEKDAKKQMQQYRNEARERLKNGDISVDEIEKALGGDTLKKYNDSVRLLEEYNKLNRIKAGDLTGEQSDRLAELKEQVKSGAFSEESNKNLKQQLSEEVSRLTQNDQFIRASYDERAKRSKAYEADLSKYDEKAQATIQKAMDSGILNNTKKTHAFVDMIAKLSADKGVSFDFTNSQRLKESGFALDGKIVNGYIQDGNITLNINSAKALNKVVGHEITHVLEGTELYTELQDTIIQYAKGKGDYDSRWENIVKLYRKQFEGQENESRMAQYKAELTADLVGDYLFSDSDFVNKLSAEQPNVFKKIYDEIKYMVKVATAGSKEEKQLLEVKRAFDKAYKENSQKNTENVRFDLVGKDEYGIEIYETSEETKKLSYADRKAKLLDIMKNEYAGRTAKFEKNSQTYYALYDKAGIKKGVYGDKKSSPKGAKAKINIGADGNYIELAENAMYTGSSKEQGKPTKFHKDAKSWDYYVKTIKSDGTYYDVLINVKDNGNDQYVYDITLNEADSLPNQLRSYTGSSSASNNIISEDAENTTENPKNSLGIDENPARNDVYGTDIMLDIPTRSDIAPVQDVMDDIPIRKDIPKVGDFEDIPIRADVTPPTHPETVQAEEATMLPEEQWLEQKLNRIEKHLERDIQELNAEYDERLKDAMSQQMRESIETERLHRIDELEIEAEKERARARDSAEKINRKELYESIINNIKSAFAKMGFDFDKVLVNAKNKSTFSSVDNTPQRFMEKSLGYKEGQVLADLTINKTALNESRAVSWLNYYTNRENGVLAQIVKEYGIKPRSKESAAAQMYGEGFYVNEKGEYVKYSDAELAKDFPNVDTQEKIKRLAKDSRIRQIYDETLEAINESRRRNGYPEIPRRKDYFLHFQAMTDTFSTLGIPFNPNDIRAKDLPTDLNGVTADLKPGQPYFASANQRKGIRTTYDLLGGLEQYLSSAKNQIYHIDDIQTFRALRNYVADTFGQAHGFDDLDELSEAEIEERIKDIKNSHLSIFAKFLNEQANIMAGKTALIDRGFEGMFGRRAITFMKDLNQQVGSNMVGYNLSSSFTNCISMVQGFAKANKAAATKAMVQTISNRINQINGRSDRFVEADPLYIRRMGADKFTVTLWEKLKEPGYLLSGAVDSISTEFLVRCKYNELTQKGMDDTKAHIEADKWAARILGDRTYGQMPQLYNSQVLGLVTKFQLEVRNQLDSMFYDTIQEKTLETEQIQDELSRNRIRAAQIASTFTQLAVFQHLFGQAFEAVAGYNPTFDIIEVAMTMFGWDDEEESKDTFGDNLNQGFQALLEDLPYTSIFMDGGRMPISSALPVGELLTGIDEYGNPKSRVETALEALPYYVIPGGYGQLKKTAQGLGMFADNLPIAGSYTDSGKLRFSVDDDIPTRLQAAAFGQYASKNARDYFDNGRSPLTEKQTRELVMLDIPIRRYWDYRQGLKKIEADRDEDGNAIPGSKKQKIIEYIDGLDVDYEEKLILFKFQYPADDTYNYEILEYLKTRDDITDAEKKVILKDLDFTVDENGNVRW